jgi:hypothetical protein
MVFSRGDDLEARSWSKEAGPEGGSFTADTNIDLTIIHMDRFVVFAAQVRFMFWLEIEGSSTDQAGEPSFHISLYAAGVICRRQMITYITSFCALPTHAGLKFLNCTIVDSYGLNPIKMYFFPLNQNVHYF